MIKVLYAEDDADIRGVAEIALEDEGFDLCFCEDGQQAVSKAPEYNADLIMLDVMMPGLTGPDTLVQLRKIKGYETLPVIFMTAKVQPGEIEQYHQLGAIGVIAKPFDPMELSNDIRKLMEQAA